MDYLVDCPCGHTLGRHDVSGCADRHCSCRRARAEALDSAIDAVTHARWNDVDEARIKSALHAPGPARIRMSRLATMDEIVGTVGLDGQERHRAPDAKGPPSGVFWGCGCVASRAPKAETFVWLRCETHRQTART